MPKDCLEPKKGRYKIGGKENRREKEFLAVHGALHRARGRLIEISEIMPERPFMDGRSDGRLRWEVELMLSAVALLARGVGGDIVTQRARHIWFPANSSPCEGVGRLPRCEGSLAFLFTVTLKYFYMNFLV